MKNLKRSIMIFLAFSVLFSAAFVPRAFAVELESEGWSYQTAESGIVITGYSGSGGDVTVPSVIDGKAVIAIADNALAGNADVVSLVVPEGVVSIGEEAFADCPNLESVTLPESVTGIGRRAFRYCQKLESVTLPSNLSEFPYQGFWDCEGLTEIVIPDGVTVIPNGTFYNCFALRSVTVPESVTAIEKNAFHACLRLESIELSEKVTDIDESAFSDCEYLIMNAPEGSVAAQYALDHDLVPEPSVLESDHPYESSDLWEYTYDGEAAALKVTFSSKTFIYGSFGFDTLTVTDGEGTEFVFTGDELSGKTLVLAGNSFTLELFTFASFSDFGFRVTAIEPMSETEYRAYVDELNENPWEARVVNGTLEICGYRGTKGSAVLPARINGISVAAVADFAFRNNRILTDLVIESGVLKIGKNAFEQCIYLNSVSIPDTVEEIGEGAFLSCISLQELVFPSGLTAVSSDVANGCSSLERAVLPPSAESIGENAFSVCKSLKEISIPETVTEIGSNAFSGSGLTSITVPDGVSAIPDYFCEDCTDLETVKLPANLTEIGGSAFSRCGSLSEITLPAGVVTLGKVCFGGTGLTSIELPDGLTSIGASALSATGIRSLYIPASVTEIGDSLVYNCTDLTELVVDPDNPRYTSRDNMVFNKAVDTLIICAPGISGAVAIPEGVVTIGMSACSTMTNMTELILPQTLSEIGINAFNRCSALERVDIPRGVTVVPEAAFDHCTSLQEVVLPDTVTAIERSAFGYCAGLKHIDLPAGLVQLGSGAFNYSGLESIVVPNGVESIAGYVFGFCPDLKFVSLPDRVLNINRNAFYNSPCVIFATADSDSFNWAKNNGIVAVDPPKAVEDLMASGGALTLVTPGTASGGALYYAVKTDANAVPAEEEYSEALPAATEAGEYYVWFKVTAGGKDTVGPVLTVSVAPDNARLVADIINGLPAAGDIKTSDKDSIVNARAAYEALTEEEKARIGEETIKKLAGAEAALDSLDYTLLATEGLTGNGVWIKGGKDGIVITVKSAGADESFERFAGVRIDGSDLVRGKDYTVEKGSTVVKIKPSALDKLSVGKHTVTILFNNGTVETAVNVQAASRVEPTANPQTGDDGRAGVWLVVIIGFCTVAAAILSGKKKESSEINGFRRASVFGYFSPHSVHG